MASVDRRFSWKLRGMTSTTSRRTPMPLRPGRLVDERIEHALVVGALPAEPLHRHAGADRPLAELANRVLAVVEDLRAGGGLTLREEHARLVGDVVAASALLDEARAALEHWCAAHAFTSLDTIDSTGTPVSVSMRSAKSSAGCLAPEASMDT